MRIKDIIPALSLVGLLTGAAEPVKETPCLYIEATDDWYMYLYDENCDFIPDRAIFINRNGGIDYSWQDQNGNGQMDRGEIRVLDEYF